MKHTILGAGGSIGNTLTYELLKYEQSVRLVSRSKYQINGADSFYFLSLTGFLYYE